MAEREEEKGQCFRCGYIDEDYDVDEGISTCSHCGEQGIMSFTMALDILNDLHLNGRWIHDTEETEDKIDEYSCI